MSRIETNSVKLRTQLESRNLYSVGNEYGTSTPTDKVLNSIRSITNVISPLNKLDTNLSMLYSRIVNPTPIVVIGMKMLADQFAKTVASNAGMYASQMVNVKNLFDGDKTTKFWTGKDYQITIRDDQSKIGKILEKLTGYQNNKSPFTEESTFADYLNNTGSGQLSELLKVLNRNKYIPQADILQNFLNENKKIGSLVELKNILANEKYSRSFIPDYSRVFEYNVAENDSINEKIVEVFGTVREYSSSIDDVVKYHGKSINKRFITKDIEKTGKIFDDYTYGFQNSDELIWGLDGLNYKKNFDNGIIEPPTSRDIESTFDIKVGLLKYTAELVNSSRGKIIDITKKKFFDPNNSNNLVGYNGAGIYKHSFDESKDGIRQHTVIDPYNKFAKAIRFDGNKIYAQGNENSVIYNSVIPKIHPTYLGGKINNRNMMFSIENLAVEVIKNEENNYAYLNDEFSTVLPISEAGPLGGRMLWFPPYDLRFREQTTNKLETNTFIGRSEPLYTYNGSERTANLEFKLLIDYPLNVLQYRGSSNFHQKVSEFFLFGGLDAMNFSDLAKLQSELAKTNEELSNYKETQKLAPKPFNDIELKYYFDNDVPKASEVGSYDFENSDYEDGYLSNEEADDFGLNISNGNTIESNYDLDYDPALKFTNRLKTIIEKYLSPENANNVAIEFNGYASLLHTSQYNQDLTGRRIESVSNYFDTLYLNTYGKLPKDAGFTIRKVQNGSTLADPLNGTPDAINNLDTKKERYTSIKFTKSNKVEYKEEELSAEDKQNKEKLLKQKDQLETKINEKKKYISNYDPNSFKEYTINDKVMNGFESIEKDVYVPCFHSQTPEDFHRRLTFLQQCMRQGRSTGDAGKNSIFGKQPVCVLRIGDFQHTRIMIESLAIDYSESTWDMNPEGIGMQPMIADVSLQFKIIGGQSLAMPLQMLQNATTFNYYANSTFLKDGTYTTPVLMESLQIAERLGLNTDSKQKKESSDLSNKQDKAQITENNNK